MKKAFSLAEVMVVITIIGIISALVMTVVSTNNATNLKVLYKSAFNTVNSVVQDVSGNLTAFPTGVLTNNGTTSPVTYALCQTFIADINTVSSNPCTTASSAPNTPNFVTANGMRWYGFDNDFNSYGNITVEIDVDGAGKGLNTDNVSIPNRDILRIVIFNTGKISTPDSTGAEALYLTQ